MGVRVAVWVCMLCAVALAMEPAVGGAGAHVEIAYEDGLEHTLAAMPGVVLDRPERAADGRVRALRAFVEDAEAWRALQAAGVSMRVREEEAAARAYWHALQARTAGSTDEMGNYTTYEELEEMLRGYATAYPSIFRMYSIGQSVLGRELWVAKVTSNVDVDDPAKPQFKYVGNMHGDETVGRELLVRLLRDLLEGYADVPSIRVLVDNIEIHVCVSMNPDGFAMNHRTNAHNKDLNRNFPDQWTDPTNSVDGRQPETQHVMRWIEREHFALSANLHGGALVANYPYDNNERQRVGYAGTADDALFRDLALTYSREVDAMYASSEFSEGVTNGAEWYLVNGGMQDWNYVYNGVMELTIEVANTKTPDEADIPGYYADQKNALLAYMRRALRGVRGVVVDADTQVPIVGASVRVEGNDELTVHTYGPHGAYVRLLLADDDASHTLTFEAPGYAPLTLSDVKVTDEHALAVHSVAMTRTGLTTDTPTSHSTRGYQAALGVLVAIAVLVVGALAQRVAALRAQVHELEHRAPSAELQPVVASNPYAEDAPSDGDDGQGMGV